MPCKDEHLVVRSEEAGILSLLCFREIAFAFSVLFREFREKRYLDSPRRCWCFRERQWSIFLRVLNRNSDSYRCETSTNNRLWDDLSHCPLRRLLVGAEHDGDVS
jgi:hypothetical protein